MDAYLIAIKNNNITDEECEEFLNDYLKILKYKKLLVIWQIYYETINQLKNFGKNASSKFLTSEMNLKKYALANVYICNSLNAFYMFEQYCEHNFTCFKEEIKQRIYDNNFSYRLIYNLRTYSTHCEIPISKIKKYIKYNDFSEINLEFLVSKNEFSEAKGLQPKVQKEVSEIIREDDIQILNYFKEVELILLKVITDIILHDKIRIINVYEKASKYIFGKPYKAASYFCRKGITNLCVIPNLKFFYYSLMEVLLENEYCNQYIDKTRENIEKLCVKIKNIMNFC